MTDPVHLPLTALKDDEKMFQKAVLDFARQEIAPLVSKMDETETMDKELIQKLFDMGLMAIETPESHGGAGSSFFNAILAIEALAQVDPSVSVLVDVQNTLVANAFLRWGTQAQRDRYLKLMSSAKGGQIGSYCLTEPNSGSDAFALRTRATVAADGSYRLTGKKVFITNAKEADIFLVFANLNPEQGYKGITAFVVERSFKGFSVGKKEVKLGIRASSTCEILFDDCVVPKENVLGEIGKGYKIAIETLNEGRIGIAAQMLGLAQGAFDASLKYVREREQFGKSIASFQGVQFQIGQMATDIEAARLMVYNAARLKDAKMEFVKEAAMAKHFASKVAEDVASIAIELHGGYGFIKEFPVEKFYRDAKIGKIYEGTTNMQLQTIAKAVLG
ncbi:MAG: acyl-CoA dehydrogenase [Silvanigrellales bacterium]|jgi:alkylation response protein AidB-like acyl-CoA dehydrogenase|nr:acyl-CoA dehydrogenase [Silvanigrellales bacterium]